MITRAPYLYTRERRVVGDFGPCCYDVDLTVELEADVTQDCALGMASELCVVWTDECLRRIAAAGLSGDELVGCVEVIEEAFWLAEQAEERKAMVAQQVGNQGFFDQRATAAE